MAGLLIGESDAAFDKWCVSVVPRLYPRRCKMNNVLIASAITAADLMTRNVITVKENTPASDVVQLLLSKSISGVPVVDEQDRCVGVFSLTDYSRIAKAAADQPGDAPIPCPYQVRHRRHD